MHAEIFPAAVNHTEIKVTEEYSWAMTGSGAVMLQPVRFQCIVFHIWSGRPCIYMRIWPINTHIWLAQNLTHARPSRT
jgi:hypothetical protein